MKKTSNESTLPILPEPTLRRLPWYLAFVSSLNEMGVEYVSTTAISRSLNVDSSRIAKDLSFLSLKGKTRIGYEVATLQQKLEDFLGFGREHAAVIVGVGSLGSALIADKGLRRYGLNIVAAFDINPEIVGREVAGVKVDDISLLPQVRRQTGAEIGIVAVPASATQLTAERLVDAGVSALWNFTPFRITLDSDTIIHNTSIYANLAVIYNRLTAKGLNDIRE